MDISSADFGIDEVKTIKEFNQRLINFIQRVSNSLLLRDENLSREQQFEANDLIQEAKSLIKEFEE